MGVKRNPMHSVATTIEASLWEIEQARYFGGRGRLRAAKKRLVEAKEKKRKLRRAIKLKRKQKHAKH